MRHYESIIIGAGQAGLAAGYYLKQAKHPSFLILEQAETIGNSWKERYDSLVLFTPAAYSSLPGYPFPAHPDQYPTKEDVAAYLQTYADHWELPVQTGVKVLALTKGEEGFILQTPNGSYTCRQVMIASGPFQTPLIPSYPGIGESDLFQMHSSRYKNPDQLPPGPVLVVGGGNSGAQIAVEVSRTHPTFLSVRKKLQFKSLTLFGKSIFWWGTHTGIIHAPTTSWIGKRLQAQGDPVYGKELKHLLKNKQVKLVPEISSFQGKSICLVEGQSLPFSTVIWSTGFRTNYDWITIPELFDEHGAMRHQQGISVIPGLFFLGLPWQRARSSALLMGAGRDARFITRHVLAKSDLGQSAKSRALQS